MSEWVKLCAVHETPALNTVMEAEVKGISFCIANVEGRIAALDNWCPHRRGALGQGWVEGDTVVCPLHCWAFDTVTGEALPPDRGRVTVFPTKFEDDALWVDLA